VPRFRNARFTACIIVGADCRVLILLCPNCAHALDFHFRDQPHSEGRQYIAERFELCPKCEYKRLLSRVTESGQILYGSTNLTRILDDFEPLFDLGSKLGTSSMRELIQLAVETAPHICLIADDDRRYVDVNRAATEALGVEREGIIGQRIDEFFAIAPDLLVPTAWDDFVSSKDQFGVCELLSTGVKFEYRARANFLPGLHISLLRRVKQMANDV
jgi:PAS domain-containing protein